MIEEPYRWLEAIENRREYVREQIKDGTPAFALSLKDGILLLAIGAGHSKVFEIFDRHALAGLGHPADIEKIRQTAIDAAHMEGFIRAAEDVSLRRLVSFGLGPQVKTNFEQIFGAPYLIELLFAEVGATPKDDLFARLHFDGAFEIQSSGVVIAASRPEAELASKDWLKGRIHTGLSQAEAAEFALQAWGSLTENKPPGNDGERAADWRSRIEGKTVEIGWLARNGKQRARFERLSLDQLGL